MRRLAGIARSLLIYYGIPFRAARLRRFYSQFVPRGSLCVDVGAHVGNRVRAWRALGARVVAVEPQADCLRILRALYGRDEQVIIAGTALGAAPGSATLLISARTPTVTTLSREWIDEVRGDPGFEGVTWDAGDEVPVTTLQAIIDAHGLPAFVKIDVEGYEAEVLRGVHSVLPCLSFEYLPAARQVALACIDRLESMADYRFNWSCGESHRLQLEAWCDAHRIRHFIQDLAPTAGSGDIYARLR